MYTLGLKLNTSLVLTYIQSTANFCIMVLLSSCDNNIKWLKRQTQRFDAINFNPYSRYIQWENTITLFGDSFKRKLNDGQAQVAAMLL